MQVPKAASPNVTIVTSATNTATTITGTTVASPAAAAQAAAARQGATKQISPYVMESDYLKQTEADLLVRVPNRLNDNNNITSLILMQSAFHFTTIFPRLSHCYCCKPAPSFIDLCFYPPPC